MRQEETISIVMYADNAYAMPLAVAIRSILKNLSHAQRLQIFVLDCGISSDSKEKIIKSFEGESVSLDFICFHEEEFFSLVSINNPHLSKTIYARTLLDKYLPASLRKVLCIDSDLIALGDVGKLWELPFRNKTALVVPDISNMFVGLSGSPIFRSLGIPEKSFYFNSGLMLVDLDQWREKKISQQIWHLVKTYKGQYKFEDQCLLNAALYKEVDFIPLKWNSQARLFSYPFGIGSPFPQKELREAKENPLIVHFTTSAKPWNSKVLPPFGDLFFEYLDGTAWAGWRPKACSNPERMIRVLAWQIKRVRITLRQQVRLRWYQMKMGWAGV